MKSDKPETKSFRLSKRLRVQISAGVGGVVCDWSPCVPESLTRAEAQAYRAAFSEMVGRLGVHVLVVELPGIEVGKRP